MQNSDRHKRLITPMTPLSASKFKDPSFLAQKQGVKMGNFVLASPALS